MTCPLCQSDRTYKRFPAGGVCCDCGNQWERAAVAVAMTDPCAEPDDAFDGPESELVEAIREWCVAHGLRCDRIGQHVAKRSGTDRGVGDLMIRRREKGVAIWQAFEAKTKGKTFTPEQRLRIENGDLLPAFCVRQVEEALS